MENLHAMFQLPRSAEAFQQYLELAHELDNLLLELAHELDSLIPTGENDFMDLHMGKCKVLSQENIQSPSWTCSNPSSIPVVMGI
jgi:hypothetical protein